MKHNKSMLYLAIMFAIMFVMTLCVGIAYAGHGCPDSGHGSDPSGGHGNGHGGGDNGGDNGGNDSGTSGGSSAGTNGGFGGSSSGDGAGENIEVTVNCTLVEWLNNGYSCLKPLPEITDYSDVTPVTE